MSLELAFFLIGLPVILVGLLHIPFIDIGLDLADEGYLLFGCQSVLKGKTPIRDFRSYDPGRYYWCWPWLKFFGPNIMAIRYAMAGVMMVSVALYGLTLSSYETHWLVPISASIWGYMWMFKRHKQLEVMFSLVAVSLLSASTALDPAHYLLVTGLLISVSFFFGLNIFLYVGASTALVHILFPDLILLRMDWPDLGCLILGLGIGCIPFARMMLLDPGFSKAYWNRKIAPILRRGTTNLPLPIPWLWSARAQQIGHFSARRKMFFKMIFTALPLVYLLIIASRFALPEVMDNQAHTLAAIASVVGLIYLHPVYSRADVSHLSQGIHPLVLALSALSVAWLPGPMAALPIILAGLISAWVILPVFDEGFQQIVYNKKRVEGLENYKTLRLTPPQAQLVNAFASVISENSRKGETLFTAPVLPGLHALFNRQPACYDTFAVYPASKINQHSMLSEIKQSHPALAIIQNSPIDGRKDLIFSNNYDQVWAYFKSQYTRIDHPDIPDSFSIFVRKDT